MEQKLIIVIGGGAAGFFSAINAAKLHPNTKIIILEKSGKLLSKVRISGGGRCNVTHHCFDNSELVKFYPRGQKELRQVFSQFSVKDTIEWFAQCGIKLKTESDGRMFPESNSSETIINCFLNEAKKHQISIHLHEEVVAISKPNNQFILVKTTKENYFANAVICSTGGHHQEHNYQFIKQLGHKIEHLIPSLFTINLPQSNIKQFMGLSVQEGTVKVLGTKHHYSGPILITHWGLSGPAVLKLSAFAAQDLFDLNYNVSIAINWTTLKNEEEIKNSLLEFQTSKAKVVNTPLFNIPKRLWEYMVERSEIDNAKPWHELNKKQFHKLSQILGNDVYQMQGKTTFKEEFVTAGGVNLKQIDFKTMQSKVFPGLFFCGEVLNIDGITGGFNFQNAWSTAWIAAKYVLEGTH